jgi:hypothetical protein
VEKIPGPGVALDQKCGTASVFSGARSVSAGVLLAISASEHHVFRAVVLSVVLILAVGPTASLLCRTGCDPQVAAASECDEHPGASPGMAGDDSCDSVVLSAAFLREHTRRNVSSPDRDLAIPVPRYQAACSSIDATPGHKPERGLSLDRQSLPTVLRI